jgi:hypothetical protein
MKSTFIIIVSCILLFIAIVFMMYVCGYLINDCMTHPVNFGCCKTDVAVYPTTITENALYAGEQV